MRLAVFLSFMLVSCAAVGIWAYLDDAGAGLIALRVIGTAIALQVVYFLLVLASAYLFRSDENKEKAKRPRKNSPPSLVGHSSGTDAKRG